MEYQSFGRTQRPKGANIKETVKVMLVLAVGAWLLYQIKQSRNNTENYTNQTELEGGYGATLLGRKGTPSRLDEIVLPHSGNVDSAGEDKESSSGRDDGSDGAKEDKAEEEFGHINEKFSREKEVELEPGSQPEVSSKKKYKSSSKIKSGKVGRRSASGHKEHGNEKYPKGPILNDSKSNDEEKQVQLRIKENATSDFSEKENDGDEGRRIREREARMQKNVVEGATNAEVTEEIDEVQSFHDENGVPPGVNETEIVFGLAQILHEESWLRKTIYDSEIGKDRKIASLVL